MSTDTINYDDLHGWNGDKFNAAIDNKPVSPWDPVEKPRHYADTDRHGGYDYNIECIDWIEAELTTEEFDGYLKGCALKYIWRYNDKGHGTEDLRKAQWYLNKLEKRCGT